MSNTTTIPPIPQNIKEIAAPPLLGGIWNWCLYGTLTVQFYVYTYNFPRDRKFIKLLVYGVFLLETLRTALSGADLYSWFVSGYGDINHLASPRNSSIEGPILGSVVSLSVQLFFVYRIWVLGKKGSWWLCILICLFSVVDTTAALMAGVYGRVHGRIAHGRTLRVLAITWLVSNTASDVLIAAAILYHMALRRTEGGCLRNHALVRIVRLTVETNILTTTVSIISLLLILLYPDKSYFVCPISILGKLYSNTLIVSLNNRISIRDASVACGGLVQSAAGLFPDTTRSEATTDIVLMEVKKSPNAPKIRSLEETESQGRVISEAHMIHLHA